jgi:hypothetical protein
MWATAQRKDIDMLADAVSTTLRQIADEGPTVEELAVDLDGWRRSLDNPESRQAEAHRLAIQELLGAERETFEDLDRSMAATTPEDVRNRFREAYASAIMTLPRGVPAGKRGFTSYPSLIEGRPSGKHFTNVDEPRVALGHRQLAQLVVGTSEIGLEAPAGNGLRIRFEEAAGLILAPNGVATVVHNSGADITIDPRRWRNGEAAIRLVEGAMPRGRQVRLLALDDVERTQGRRSRSHLSRSRLRMTIAAVLALASLALLVIGQPLLDLGLQYSVKFPDEGFLNGFSWSGVLILVGAALVGSAAIAAWQFEPFVWTAGTVAVPVLIVGSLVGMVAQSAPQDAIPMGIALALRVYLPLARARVGGQV